MRFSRLYEAVYTYAILPIMLILLGIFLYGCDSSGGGGGGTATDSSGYTQAMLAKQWVVTQSGPPNPLNGWVTFDQSGQFTQWFVNGGNWLPVIGKLAVSSSGRVRGTVVRKFGENDPAFDPWIRWDYHFDLQFQNDGTLRGTMQWRQWLIYKTTGVKAFSVQVGYHWLLRPKSG